jgi:hypothetical protein
MILKSKTSRTYQVMSKVSAKRPDQTNEGVSPLYEEKELFLRDKIFRVIVVASIAVLLKRSLNSCRLTLDDANTITFGTIEIMIITIVCAIHCMVTDGYKLGILDSSAGIPKNVFPAKRKTSRKSNYSRLIISLHSSLILLT